MNNLLDVRDFKLNESFLSYYFTFTHLCNIFWDAYNYFQFNPTNLYKLSCAYIYIFKYWYVRTIKSLFNSFIRCPLYYELFSFTPLPRIKFLLNFFISHFCSFHIYFNRCILSGMFFFFLFVISHIRHLSLFICPYLSSSILENIFHYIFRF